MKTRILPPLIPLLLMLPAVVQAQYDCTTINGTITITRYTGSGGAVIIPETIAGLPVTSIGAEAFAHCTSLTSVTIPASVTNIRGYAFLDCTSLTAITVDALNPVYSSVGGVLFNKSQTTVLRCPEGKAASYTIPDSVTSLGGEAFLGCTSLTSITIPDSVTSLGGDALFGCFYGCTSLTSVTIGNSVTSIGSWTFADCTSLTSVTIGKSVTSLGGLAFYGCTSLTGIYFQGNAPWLDMNAIHNPGQLTIYCLPGATGWHWLFGFCPTALWIPQVETSDASFGVRTNQFGFNITWASDKVVVVEANTNLSNPTWSPIGTNTLRGGSAYFSDPQWTNYPGRFYRLRSP